MRSSTILAIHTAMFGGLMVLSPSTSLLVIYKSPLLPAHCLVYLCLIGIATTWVLWWFYSGCPCTNAEKKALQREGKEVYEGPWLAQYANEWFGVQMSARTSSNTPLMFLLIPLLIGVLHW